MLRHHEGAQREKATDAAGHARQAAADAAEAGTQYAAQGQDKASEGTNDALLPIFCPCRVLASISREYLHSITDL